MNKQLYLNNDSPVDLWDTNGLTFLAYWALRKRQYGHSLLIFHATAFGAKPGNLLHLRWNIFKKELVDGYVTFDKNEFETEAGNGEKLLFELDLITHCEFVFNVIIRQNPKYSFDDYMYTNSKTGKVLTTSTLRRELQTLYKKTKEDIKELYGCELLYREMETNAFEIAWAREIVRYYRFTKQAFIKVSKRMGHRTLNDTIALLGFDMMEDIDLKIKFYDANFYKIQQGNLDKMLSGLLRMYYDEKLNYKNTFLYGLEDKEIK